VQNKCILSAKRKYRGNGLNKGIKNIKCKTMWIKCKNLTINFSISERVYR